MTDQPAHFGMVLAEAMAELKESDGAYLPPDDPIERLRLAAHQTLLAQSGAVLPKVGARVYLEDAPTIATPEGHQLDVKF